VEAVRDFTDAALMAVHAGNRAHARRLIERARVLADSPLIDAERRAALSSRFPLVG